MEFLDFALRYADLAEEIASRAAARAAVVGSGRVGRTQMLPIEERAALAARADIRHRHTTYDDELGDDVLNTWDQTDRYRDIKRAAHAAVDDFLTVHRRR